LIDPGIGLFDDDRDSRTILVFRGPDGQALDVELPSREQSLDIREHARFVFDQRRDDGAPGIVGRLDFGVDANSLLVSPSRGRRSLFRWWAF